MMYADGIYIEVEELGAETIAEYEARACITLETIRQLIRQDRARFPDSPGSHMPDTLACNDPNVSPKGLLKKYEDTKAWKMLIFLAELRDGKEEVFSLRHAYTKAGVRRQTYQNWRHDHVWFDKMVESVQEEMVDTLRAEAYRRAVVGVDEPIFYQGNDTGHRVKKYSDSLLQFTLMGYDAKFRAKDVNMNVSGSLETNVNIEGLRDRLAARLNSRAKAQSEAEGEAG